MKSSRRGFALTAALIGVVLIGALITGAFIATTEETRISGNAVSRESALESAESAVESQLSAWSQARADSQPIGSIRATSGGGSGAATTTWQVRLDSAVFLIAGESRSADETAGHSPMVRRRIGILVRTGTDSAGHVALSIFDKRAWAELF